MNYKYVRNGFIAIWQTLNFKMLTFEIKRKLLSLKQCVVVYFRISENLNYIEELTSLTAFWAASRLVNVTNAYPRFVPVIGSIIKRRSHIVPHFSNNGINSSSYMSFGILPQNTSQPLPGVGPSQLGGGPPYFL